MVGFNIYNRLYSPWMCRGCVSEVMHDLMHDLVWTRSIDLSWEKVAGRIFDQAFEEMNE